MLGDAGQFLLLIMGDGSIEIRGRAGRKRSDFPNPAHHGDSLFPEKPPA
jgi:hypothetical protein